MIYDILQSKGQEWKPIKDAMLADPMVTDWYNDPHHKSGRGAGGACFIKDFVALKNSYSEHVGDELGIKAFEAFERKNVQLLLDSQKDLDLLKGVYGEHITHTVKPEEVKKDNPISS